MNILAEYDRVLVVRDVSPPTIQLDDRCMLEEGAPITLFHIASNHTLKFEMLYLVIHMGLPIKNN